MQRAPQNEFYLSIFEHDDLQSSRLTSVTSATLFTLSVSQVYMLRRSGQACTCTCTSVLQRTRLVSTLSCVRPTPPRRKSS